jgi:hypothetical protein
MKPTGYMTIGSASPELLLNALCASVIAGVTIASPGCIFVVPLTAGALLAVALRRRRNRATHPTLSGWRSSRPQLESGSDSRRVG